MPGTRDGSAACPDSARRRLAVQLTDMIPGAATIDVTLTAPHRSWPHPCATVRDAAGRRVAVSVTVAEVAARWVVRAFPEADWSRAQVLDLPTATLTAGTAGRGC
jgi:hypothetical protein